MAIGHSCFKVEIKLPPYIDCYLLVSRTPASPSTARAAAAAAAAQSSSAQKRSPSSTDSGHSSNGAMGPSASGTPSAAYSRLTGNTPSGGGGGSKRQTVHGGHPAKGNVQHHTVFVQGEDFEFIFLNGISSSLYIIFLYFFSNQRWFLKLD